jgi:hypothetical protein
MRTPPPLAVLASRVRTEEKQIFAALDRRGVNHTVEFQGFQGAHEDRLDVAGAIADHLLGQPVPS